MFHLHTPADFTQHVCLPAGSSLCTVSHSLWTWRAGCGTSFAGMARRAYSGRVWASCICTRKSCCRWTSSTSRSSSRGYRRTCSRTRSSTPWPAHTWSAGTAAGLRSGSRSERRARAAQLTRRKKANSCVSFQVFSALMKDGNKEADKNTSPALRS